MKKYFDMLSEFYNIVKYENYNSSEILLYYTLLAAWNKTGRKEWFSIYNDEIRNATKYNLKTIQDARNKLCQKGIIKYKKGAIGQAPQYSLTSG